MKLKEGDTIKIKLTGEKGIIRKYDGLKYYVSSLERGGNARNIAFGFKESEIGRLMWEEAGYPAPTRFKR